MTSEKIPAIIQSVLDNRTIEAGEVLTLRRWFYGDGMLHEADAEALFKANAALAGSHAEFNRLFVEALTDFIIYQQMPTGRISAGQARWLIGLMGGPEARLDTVSELELLINVMEEAHEIPQELATFALAQVKHAAITGEGPAAKGRVHFSRTVDQGDVALLTRILARSASAGISRAEAEILFDIADACTGLGNAEGWDRLFVRAIANHILGTAAPLSLCEPADAEPLDWSRFAGQVDPSCALWLRSRLHRDGQISRAEQALLAFVGSQSAAETAAREAIIRMA